MTWEKNLVAVRSLRSEHHANNIEPNITIVNWNLGKRCNYDCSYCGPEQHDWISPHHSLDSIKSFISQLSDWSNKQNKTFTICLTGGEPFIHPEIIEILQEIKQASSYGEQLVAITNGSLPLDLYQQSLEFLTHLTISLHLERSASEIQSALDKILALHQQFPDKWISVQVMCLPGKFDFLEHQIIPFLESNNIKFSLVRIRPWINEVKEWQNLPKKQIIKTEFTIEQQTQMKRDQKKILDTKIIEIYDEGSYYTAEELDWLKNQVPKTVFQNVGAWNTDLNYFETNCELIVVNDRNRFTGWNCFIGIDSMTVDFDGTIYRGTCMNGGPVGKIGSPIDFSTTPTVCAKPVCHYIPDLTVRKSLPEFLHLITKSS
jgi:organic radical activating enzyme